jgi:hypothetical protein
LLLPEGHMTESSPVWLAFRDILSIPSSQQPVSDAPPKS